MESGNDERLLTPMPEARRKLGGIGHTTLYELIKRRELRKVTIGRRAFVVTESLTAYVNRISKKEAETAEAKTVEVPKRYTGRKRD